MAQSLDYKKIINHLTYLPLKIIRNRFHLVFMATQSIFHRIYETPFSDKIDNQNKLPKY